MPGPGRAMQCLPYRQLSPCPVLHLQLLRQAKQPDAQLNQWPICILSKRNPPLPRFLPHRRLRRASTAGQEPDSRHGYLSPAAAVPVVPAAAAIVVFPVAATAATIAASPTAADAMASSLMAGSAAIWATCLVLFVGALLTGLPPVCWSSHSLEKKATVPSTGMSALLQGPAVRMLSAGLMLGSGLGVVLPEGFHAFVEGAPAGEHAGLPEWCAGAALLSGFVVMLSLQLWLQGDSHTHNGPPVAAVAARSVDGAIAAGDGAAPDGNSSGSSMGWRRRREGGYSALPSAAAGEPEGGMGRSIPWLPPASAVATVTGVSVVSEGLELSRRHGGGSTAHFASSATAELPMPASYACTIEASVAAAASAVIVEEPSGPSGPSGPSCSSSLRTAATARVANLDMPDTAGSGRSAGTAAPTAGGGGVSSAHLALGGLLIHSTADGLAIGAASLGSGGGGPSALSLTVAAAIMMHKLPVTLGLTSYLREAGWRRGKILQALLAFSASAPIAALATFYLLGFMLMSSDSGGGGGVGGQWVALVVLFSGGTFLAAATQHILPSALAAVNPAGGSSLGVYGGGGGDGERTEGGLAAKEAPEAVGVGGGVGHAVTSLPMLWLVVGSLLPLLIAVALPD